MRHAPSVLAALVLGCGGSPPPPSAAPRAPDASPRAVAPTEAAPRCASGRGGMSVEGMLGTIPQARVQATLREAEPRLIACFTRRLEAVPYLAGHVAYKVRVGDDGAVRWTVPTATTLGDREAERCMAQELAGLRFEQPCGGEAEVSWSMDMDGGPDARAATEWPPARLAAVLRQRRAALATCLHGSTAAFTVTLYAAPNGSIVTAGATVPDPQAEATVDCVLRDVRAWRVPSPGSWFARASVSLP